MPFRELYKNEDLMYRVGYDEQGRALMIVTVTSVGWYDLHFLLTNEEVAMVNRDRATLDDLAQRFAIDQGKKFYADRLLER